MPVPDRYRAIADNRAPMHYRHAYHAGNFADVHKHVLLCGLAQAMSRKDKPWVYLDTHAGAGRYDLGGIEAARTGEAAEGALRLQTLENAPEPLASWQRAVFALNPGAWRLYPGSPAFVQSLARPDDRLLLCETVPGVVEELRRVLPTAIVHVRDGYEAASLLPPPEKRALVLVDPPFERRDEFAAMLDFLTRAQARFAGGVYAFWYPLKNSHEVERFGRRLGVISSRPVVDFRFDTGAKAEGQMRGSGLMIVNPPFRFVEDVAPALKLLARELGVGSRASSEVIWLKTES